MLGPEAGSGSGVGVLSYGNAILGVYIQDTRLLCGLKR